MATTPPYIAVRGIRQVIPSGFVIGRISAGPGPAELIPLFTGVSLTSHLVATGAFASASASGSDAGFYLGGAAAVAAATYYVSAPMARSLTFASTAVTSFGTCLVAPGTSTAIFYATDDLTDYGNHGPASTKILAKFQFALGALTATVTTPNPARTLVRGSFLYLIVDNAYIETTMAGIYIAVAGDPA